MGAVGRKTTGAGAGAGEARPETARIEAAAGKLRRCVVCYGAMSALVLAAVAVSAARGGQVTSFMWVRSALLLALFPLLYRMAADVARGARRAYERLGSVTVVLPLALVAVDLIPGLCPPWYTVLQGLSALALVVAAVLLRGPALRAAFPAKA